MMHIAKKTSLNFRCFSNFSEQHIFNAKPSFKNKEDTQNGILIVDPTTSSVYEMERIFSGLNTRAGTAKKKECTGEGNEIKMLFNT